MKVVSCFFWSSLALFSISESVVDARALSWGTVSQQEKGSIESKLQASRRRLYGQRVNQRSPYGGAGSVHNLGPEIRKMREKYVPTVPTWSPAPSDQPSDAPSLVPTTTMSPTGEPSESPTFVDDITEIPTGAPTMSSTIADSSTMSPTEASSSTGSTTESPTGA